MASFISHRRGIYYALLTIAFSEMFVFICIKWHTVTKGEDGLLNIRRLPAELGFASIGLKGNVALFYFVLVVFALVVWLLWRLVRSPFGHALQAIRQNDLRAGYLGYNVWLCKWLVFVLSAMVAGLAGGLFAMAQEGAYVQVMTLQWSGIVVLMTLTGGGLVSFWGPVLGTIVFFVARDVLGSLTETWLIWYGLMFMAIVMFKPDGIAGVLQDLQATSGATRRRRSARVCQTSESRAMALFETHHLHKRFGRQVVLEEVNLTFEEGRLSGIMGPNGAGKTTCFNVLTGRYKPDRGRVLFDGRDITGLPPRAIAGRGVARSFQAMNLFDDFSALLNVVLALPGVHGARYDMLGGLMREEHAATASRCWRAWACATALTSRQRTCPTATGGGSISQSLSRSARRSSSSTSRPRA